MPYEIQWYYKVQYGDKAGYWNPNNKKWNNVGSVGYVGLSRVNNNENVRTVKWNDTNSNLKWNNQKYPQMFLGFEHCNQSIETGFIVYYVCIIYEHFTVRSISSVL